MSNGGTHAAGVALIVIGGVLTGGAWTFWTRQPRTTAFLVAALVTGLVAVALLFAGITRIA
jgi:hypothetical protein